MTHNCIKPGCTTKYESSDPDPYYCPECLKAKKAIAEAIDKKLKGKPRKETKTLLQTYDQSPKLRGFVSAADLGISL